jgi:hypothetical protein
MSYIAASAGGAAAAAAITQATKASGAIVRVGPEDFIRILSRSSRPLVVTAKGGFLKPNYQYLTSYKGLFFFTKSPTELLLPGDVEIIAAREIWIPGY